MAMLIDSSDAGDLSSHSLLLEGVVMLEGGRKLVGSPVRGGELIAVLSRNKGDNVFFCLLSQNKTKTRKVQLLSARARYCLVIVVVVVVVVVGVFVLSLSFVLRDFPLSNCESTFISHARLPNFPFRNDFFFAGSNRGKGSGWSRSTSRPEKNWRSREGGDAAHEGSTRRGASLLLGSRF